LPAIGLRPPVGLPRPGGASAQADARHRVPREADFPSAPSGKPAGQVVTPSL